PFRKLPAGPLAALQVRQVAAPAEDCRDIAPLAGLGDGLVQVALDAGVALEVAVDVALGFRLGEPGPPGEAEAADAVDDAEVDGLGRIPLGRGDFMPGDPENFAGGAGVDVVALPEGLHHPFVPGKVGQNPQFDL